MKSKTNLAFGVVWDKKEYIKRIKMKKEYGVDWEWFNKLFYTILCKTMWTLKAVDGSVALKLSDFFKIGMGADSWETGARTEKIWYQQVGLVYYQRFLINS